MEFTQLELQQIINSCLCMGDPKDNEKGLWKYIEGDNFIQKSLTLTQVITKIKMEKGTVDLHDIQQKIMR